MTGHITRWGKYIVIISLLVGIIVVVAVLWPRASVTTPPIPPITDAPPTTAPLTTTKAIIVPSAEPEPEIASPLTISDDTERGLATIKHGNVVVGEIPNGWGVYKTKVIRVTDKAVYIESCRKELNGYQLFGVCPRRIYRVTLATNELRNVVNGPRGNLDLAEDISPKESLVAIGRSGTDNQASLLTVVSKNIADDSEQVFPVSPGYNQLGDLRFSPDGKKIAYAVAVGRPHDEAGAVFVVVLKTGAQTKIIETTNPNSYFRIKGWKDATTVDYTEVGL